MTLIKICGITDPEVALFAAQCGADFIGIMQHKKSKRFVSEDIAKEIAFAANEGGAKAVAVFVDTPEIDVISLCEKLQINALQHYAKNLKIPEHFTRFFVNEQDSSFRNDMDYLLIDYSHGEGRPFPEEKFISKQARTFIAGGLSVFNIEEMLKHFNPYGVDVSSGVEVNGKKDKALIAEFIKKVKNYE